jgi:hypothetical protein
MPVTPASSPPPSLETLLRPDNPRLAELEERYQGHPAASASCWTDEFVDREIDLQAFRGDNAFVWQRHRTLEAQYGLTTYYVRERDHMRLLDRLEEDGLFGADCFEVDGKLVSRDLLDSVLEVEFLARYLDIGSKPTSILDIGAGYGRLAHRATAALPNVTYTCTDGVALSTFLSEFYLAFRGVKNANVVPLDEAEDQLSGKAFDVAVNVHSFSECPISSIEWWLDLVVAAGVRDLFIVPNTGSRLVSSELDGRPVDFRSAIEERHFKLLVQTPKYSDSAFLQKHGIFPAEYFLFRRDD